MSFLAPWLLAGGLAAISLPILFHFFRRTPRDRMKFSTLMFLAPTPPRVTSRSRLENLPLLLLRAAILMLLAMAFGRPLWRQLLEEQSDVPIGSRTVLLIDTSASMRRGDLWTRAQQEAEAVIAAAGPHDEIAVVAFDSAVRRTLPFSSWREAPPGERAGLARAALTELTPSWSATKLDAALTSAAEELDAADDKPATANPEATATPDARRTNRIVLISDLQTGSRTTGLQSYEWPKHVELRVVSVVAETANAGLHPLETGAAGEVGEAGKENAAAKSPRVLITNAADSKVESFDLVWQPVGAGAPAAGAASDATTASTLKTYVPPGQTRLVRSPALPAGDAVRLVLRGDEEPFDNELWFVRPKRERLRVLHLSTDKSDDPNSLRYFLERAFSDAQAERIITVETLDPSTAAARAPTERDLDDVALVVIAARDADLPAAWAEPLAAWIERGGVAIGMLDDAQAGAWRKFLPAELSAGTAFAVGPSDDQREYALLSEIDFKHPLFAPLADPRFSDFTKIRFWRHRKATLTDDIAKRVRVVAKFDDGTPAILDVPRGAGRVVLFASGWQPRESQLGVSSKFVPLMTTLVELGSRRSTTVAAFDAGASVNLAQLTSGGDVPAGEVTSPNNSVTATASTTIPTPTASAPASAKSLSGPWVVRAPDGGETKVAVAAPRYDFAAGPGVYEVRSAAGLSRVAVNVAADESKTAPLGVEALESLGVRLVRDENVERSEAAVAERQTLQVQEMESRQKLWQWCLAAALGVIVVETWYAGRTARREALA
jgi:hypothetical protein